MTCSHHGRRDCRGLGSEPASPIAAPHTAAFVAASASSQPQDMGCSPPAPALLLPARGQAIDMDIDTAQLQPTVALLQLSSTPTQKSPLQPMEIEQPQMPSAVRDGLMEWMWTHTALNVQHSRDAMAQLLDQMPHLLMARPIPQPVYAVFVAAQTAIQHQPSSQCRQASLVPPRQARQPPSGRCAFGPPPPIFISILCVEESLQVHRCQSCQQSKRQVKQTTGYCRVRSTSYDKGSCFGMA